MVMRALLAGVGVVALSGSAQAALKPPVFAAAVSVAPVSGADIGGASEIASGDLDGDGLPDVVLTRITIPTAHVTHPVGIFLADGHGGFKDGSSMWSGPPARTEFGRQIIIADFNGDHRNDIFVADHGYDAPPFPGHPNTLVLSTPDGKLVDDSANLPPESGFSHSAAAADVNGDGSVDLYVGNLCTACTDAPPEILLNDGTGHFTRRTDLLPEDLADLDDHHRYTRSLFVDVNSDGAPDLVLGADDHTLDSRVLLNHGTDHFHDAPAPLPPKPLGSGSILISLATLDVNRDGKPDLIAGFQNGDFTGRRLQILIGNGDGTFRDETAQRLPSQDSGQGWPYAIRIADFNGDGLPDFTVDVNAYPVEDAPLYLDDGTGVYHPVPFGGNPGQFWTIVDANNDGHPDIFSVLSGNPEQHSVQLEVIPPGAPHGFHAASRRNKIHLSWTPEFGLGDAQSLEDAVARGGLPQAVVNAIGDITRAADSNSWWLLLTGVPLLLWEGYTGARALQLIHSLVWEETPPRIRPLRSSLLFSGGMCVFVATVILTWSLRDWTQLGQFGLMVLMVVPLAGLWLAVSLRLPHGSARWPALLPGAILVAIGFQVTHGLVVYLLGPKLETSTSLYGALGVVATVLFFMWVVGRIVVTAPILNSALHDETRGRQRATGAPRLPPSVG